MKARRIVPAIVAIALTTSCAAPDARPGFENVQSTIGDRTDHGIHWRTGAAEDDAADARIAELLAAELEAPHAVQVALLNNRRLQALYEDLGVAQAMLVQAGLLRNPVFSAGAEFLEAGHGTNLAFGVAWSFLDVFAMPLRVRAAEASYEAAQADVAAAVIDHAARTHAAFIRAQAAEQSVELWKQVLLASEASLEFVTRLHRAGNVRDLDVAVEQAALEEARLRAAFAEAERRAAREQLNILMGTWGGQTEWRLALRLPDIPETESLPDDVERVAVERSLALAAGRLRVDAAAARAGLTDRTALLEFLEVGAEATRDEGEWEIGPEIELPIPLFDQGQARRAIASSNLRRAMHEHYATAVEVRAAARAARDRLSAAREIALHHRDVLVPLRRRIYRETLLDYNAMQIGAVQLIQVRQAEIDAGRRLIEALRDYWLARGEMDAILAGGSAPGDLSANGSSMESGAPAGAAAGGH
ncbi:MAG: TolC family protein [Phycisphaeraceae bacterium]|nr:TolC family protein [Phycisphaerales bacterium]QOJ16404.1 MAG: TolC family protein [Phycisphaeraceae bacterium]